MLKFNEFEQSVNEAKLVVKRKYSLKNGEKTYEEQVISTRGPVRNKVLSFIASKENVSESEMKEFFSSLEESNGKRPSFDWLKKNPTYVNKKVSESGDVSYSLTKRGKRVLEKYTQFEQTK